MGKIAFVLSGGVAKGAYEAGVLRGFAECGVVPDVIVGISAGALNGAYAANLIAKGQYTPQSFEDGPINLWIKYGNIDSLYDQKCDNPSTRSLNEIFHRLGIDPLRRRYRPRWNLDAFYVFRELVKGNFTSLLNHTMLEEMLESHLTPPSKVVREVRYSAGISNILGQISLDGQALISDFRHFWDYEWCDRPKEVWTEDFSNLRKVIMASSSFPFVFPPKPIEIDGKEGLFVDGALLDNYPIDKAIEMDPEVDTIYVVLSATSISPCDALPENFYEVLTRIFNIYAGHYIVTNYQRVLEMNRRIEALQGVLDRDFFGRTKRNARNEAICQAAGFKGMEHFLSKRLLKVIPVFPTPALEGNVFSGFFDSKLMEDYCEIGYRDALAISGREKLIPQQSPATARV